ncbi:Ribosomal large subunit pseudouridine synthase F [compost metagenome]
MNKILRSEGRHEKEYIVTVDKVITPSFLKAMSEGVRILGTMTRPCQMTRISEKVFRIILTEGKNRQIRRMCSALGYEVRRLQRIRIMNIHLGNQQTGTWRELTTQEKQELGASLDYNLL